MGAAAIHADRWTDTDRQKDMRKVIGAFRDYANAPKNKITVFPDFRKSIAFMERSWGLARLFFWYRVALKTKISMDHWWNDTDKDKRRYLQKNQSPWQFVPQKYQLDWDWTRASGMTGRRLTAWAVAGPMILVSIIHKNYLLLRRKITAVYCENQTKRIGCRHWVGKMQSCKCWSTWYKQLSQYFKELNRKWLGQG